MALKVTLIGHYPPPYGGVASLMKQMEGALVSAGCRVTILNLGHGRPVADNVVNFDTDNRLLEVLQLRRRLAGSDSDVFHYFSASYRSFWLCIVCLILARMSGARMVVSFIGGALADFIGSLGFVKRAFARKVLSTAAALIGCNSEIRSVLEDLVPSRTVHQMSNSFPAPADEGGELPEEIERFLEARTPVVSITGAACAEYGLLEAVEAVGRIRSTHPDVGMVLVLTRYGTSPYRAELEGRIESLGLRDHVLIVADVPDFVSILRRSDAFLRSTLVNGDSMSVREALYLGVPAVASDTPFRPEGVIAFRKGDVADMTEKLAAAFAAGRGDTTEARAESERNLEALLAIYASAAGVAESA